MSRDADKSSAQDEVDAVLADYMRRVDAGEAIDEETLIGTYPTIAGELRAYFAHVAAVERVAASVTGGDTSRSTVTRSLNVRCPSCHATMQVAVDTRRTDVTCAACGRHFSLVAQHKVTRSAPSLSTLGRFELVERLGVGGSGSVWKARDRQLDRTVAIKIPRQGGMTAEEQDRFFLEARAAAQLRHPSIVTVHEVGRDGDSVYIVSDFVRGTTLAEWLAKHPLSSHEAAEICAEIALALHHAHELGVVHRDLKPANIMIDRDGHPHIMDFGLARCEAADAGEAPGGGGQILGTPAYMSPEQAQGEAHRADRRSDIYSLGVMLFELLTGELPFRGSTRSILFRVVHDQPPGPRSINPEIPEELETITLKCLAKDPADRYDTARELADALATYAAPRGPSEIAEIRRRLDAAEKSVAQAEAARKKAELRSRRLETALNAAISALLDGPSRDDETPWEQMEQVLDNAAELKVRLPGTKLVPEADSARHQQWKEARKHALRAQAHVLDGECEGAVKAVHRGVEAWKKAFAGERAVDLTALELLTIAAARLPGIATDTTRRKTVALLDVLGPVWDELQYPAEFKAVGMVYLAEGLMAAGERIRSVRLASQASEKLVSGKYPSFLARAKRLLEK